MTVMILTALGVVGVFLLYIFVIRPLLVKAGVVRPIPQRYRDAWGRVVVFFRKSLTMVVGFITMLGGSVLFIPQLIGDLFADPDMKAQVAALFVNWPKFVAGMF